MNYRISQKAVWKKKEARSIQLVFHVLDKLGVVDNISSSYLSEHREGSRTYWFVYVTYRVEDKL